LVVGLERPAVKRYNDATSENRWWRQPSLTLSNQIRIPRFFVEKFLSTKLPFLVAGETVCQQSLGTCRWLHSKLLYSFRTDGWLL
jgi:hypothetical protein